MEKKRSFVFTCTQQLNALSLRLCKSELNKTVKWIHSSLLTASSLSGALTQAIRNFAKSLESWLTNAMMNIPEEMVRIKVSVLYICKLN